MAPKTPDSKERYTFWIEPSLIRRVDLVAARRFGGNRSLVIRDAILRHVERLERELGIESTDESERAA